jgi:hypothetical protein
MSKRCDTSGLLELASLFWHSMYHATTLAARESLGRWLTGQCRVQAAQGGLVPGMPGMARAVLAGLVVLLAAGARAQAASQACACPLPAGRAAEQRLSPSS